MGRLVVVYPPPSAAQAASMDGVSAMKAQRLEELRDRIAKVLQWDRKSVDQFSLPTLQSFVRGKDLELDLLLSSCISRREHWFVEQPDKYALTRRPALNGGEKL
jgi:hypothetical protein